MGADVSPLSASDREALARGFASLASIQHDLPGRIARYVELGDDEEVLADLAGIPVTGARWNPVKVFSFLIERRSSTASPPAWDSLLDHADVLPALVILRLARVLGAFVRLADRYELEKTPGNPALFGRFVQTLGGPIWLEILLQFAVPPSHRSDYAHYGASRLSAELIENLLAADGHPVDLIYRKVFPRASYDHRSVEVIRLCGGLRGYGNRLALHKEIVNDALENESAQIRALSLGLFVYLDIPISPFLDRIVAMATDPTPWPGNPQRILARLASRNHDGLARLLERPDLTPLHLVRLLRLSGLLQEAPSEMLKGNLDLTIPRDFSERFFASYRDTHQPRLGLLELAAAFRASALEPGLIARARIQTDFHRRFEWEDEATWPYFADRLDWLAAELDPPPKAKYDWRTGWLSPADRRRHALAVIAAFPEPPARFLPRLWEIALGAAKTDRALAQKSLEKLASCPQRLFEALAGGKAQSRIAAAEWIVRFKPEGAAEALRSGFDSKKTTQVKAALAAALETIGTAATAADRGGEDAKVALKAEAVKGLKKGTPEKLGWFPFDSLPTVRWRGDDAPVDRDILSWLVVAAWKLKSAEPTAILRDQVGLLRPDDAESLGKAVLDAWLAADLRAPTPEELLRRLQPVFHLTGTTTIEELLQNHPEFAEQLEQTRDQPGTGRTEDKGILALVSACGPTDVVDRIQSYVNQWYGYRAAQCRALIQVLAWIEHPEAVAFLLDVARRFRTATIRQEADIQVRKLAERKGVTFAELADQSLPDAELGTRGKVVLNFGPRKFIARLDDDAQTVLEEKSGNPLESLPAPGKSDNAELAAAAKRRLTDLKKEVKAIRKQVVDRLYEAMCTQRSWTFADWQRSLLRHPVAGRLCQRVVWTLKDGPGDPSTFRPLEDGTLTDLDDNEVQPSPSAKVKVAHRQLLSYKTGARWAVHLADFVIDPLLPQFARRVFRLPKETRSATELPLRLERPAQIQPLTRRARGLGYDPVAFRLEDGGDRLIKHFPGAELEAVIRIVDFEGEQDAVGASRLVLSFRSAHVGEDGRKKARSLRLGDIPPILLSECHADLTNLAGLGEGLGSDQGVDEEEDEIDLDENELDQ